LNQGYQHIKDDFLVSEKNKIEGGGSGGTLTETKMLTRAMTKEIEAKAEHIKTFIANHTMIRKQPDRSYERSIRWFRKHGIELPAGVHERTEDEFVTLYIAWLGIPDFRSQTFQCMQCMDTYPVMDKCHDGRCIPCTNKERRQQHKRQLCPYEYRRYE